MTPLQPAGFQLQLRSKPPGSHRQDRLPVRHLYIAPVILWPYSDVLEVQCDRGNLPELLVPLYEMFQLDSVERDSGGY